MENFETLTKSVVTLYNYASKLKNSNLSKISLVFRRVAAFISFVSIFSHAADLLPELAVLAGAATIFEPFTRFSYVTIVALICFVGCFTVVFLPEKYQRKYEVHIYTTRDFMELIFSFYLFVTSICDLTIIMSDDSKNIVLGNLKFYIAFLYLLISWYSAHYDYICILLKTKEPTHYVDNSENPERIYINDKVIYRNIIYIVSKSGEKVKLRPEDNLTGRIQYDYTLEEALWDKDNPVTKFKE